MPHTHTRAWLDALNADIIEKFKTAIALGRWEDGRALDDDARATCMQAILIWEHHNLPMDARTGYIKGREGGCEVGLIRAQKQTSHE